MKVFDVIPEGFFRVLSGKNRWIYSEMLLVIRAEYKRTAHLDRSVLINQMIDGLSDLNVVLDMEADVREEREAREQDGRKSDAERTPDVQDDFEALTYSAMAHAILRRLISAGWLEQEQKADSYDLQITIPPYSISMMELLYGVTQEDTRAYKNYAFGAFSALRSIFDPESEAFMFTALQHAWENSGQLMDALKMLLNNIRRYHRMLGEYATANAILKEHFEGYQQLVNERIFHPLVTRDSVQRFRLPVLQMIGKIQDTPSILEKIAVQAAADKHYPELESALPAILQMLADIYDIFDHVEEIMLEIQKKNNAYTKASVDKLVYLLNQDRTIKEQLAHIIMGFGSLSEDAAIELSDSTRLFRQEILDQGSLYVRGKRTIRSAEAPLKISAALKSGEDLADFLQAVNPKYSYEKVVRYVESIFGERKVIHSEDFSVETDDDFVFLLLAVIYGSEKRSFYRVEFLDTGVDNGKYRFPGMRLIRKGAQP